MSPMEDGNQGGWLPVEELTREEQGSDGYSYSSLFSDSTFSVDTVSTCPSDDSEIDETNLQVQALQIVVKKRTRRGGRRNKSQPSQSKNRSTTRYSFSFKKDPWGDELICKNDWPHNVETFRIVGCNLGGVSYYYDMQEWEHVLGHTYDLQADVFCYSELNLNLYHPIVRDKLYEYKYKQDRNIKLHFACSKPFNKSEQFQMGGTVTGISGRWSGRNLNLNLDFPVKDYGRWSICHLQGKGSNILSIITIYRVCKQSALGKNTIQIQQQRDIQKETGVLVNARNKYTDDIAKVIHFLQSQSHHVILCGDANEDMNDKSSKNTWRTMLQNCNMRLISDVKFPTLTLPATYEQGHKCLDMVAMSNGLPISIIKAMGYLPYSDPILSDHRAVYVDLDSNLLFGTCLPDLTKSSFRHFNTRNMRQTNKYLDELRQHYSNYHMNEKVLKLRDDILSNKMSKDVLIARCKKLETKARELMIAAEKSLYKGRYSSKHWSSSALQHAAHTCFILKKQRRYLLKQDNVTNDELDLLEDDIADSYVRLKECQADSRKNRDDDLEYNSQELAGQWHVTTEQAKKILLHAEKSKKMFRKLKGIIKPATNSSLKSVLVPKTGINQSDCAHNDKDPLQQWHEVIDPDKVFDITLKRNAESLMRSCNAVTATGSLCDDMGFDNDNDDTIQALIDGNLDLDKYTSQYPDLKKELEAFLTAAANPTRTEMSWKFGMKEYQDLFNKTRESTACGPSGLHMSHWKALALDDELSTINSIFLWAAFHLGFVYDRWLISWHCMLLKKRHPYVNKLRIIQLFEGDFNGMLKTLLGRNLMRHIVNTNQIDDTTFGSIPGRDAKEAMKLLDMIYMNHRLMSRTLVTIFNDAAGCYDRIRPNMADFAMQRVGCPKSIANTQTIAQLKMVHKVKTAMGISPGTIKWAPMTLTLVVISGIIHYLGNIGGIGQGGGGSPVGWLVILLIMIKAYRNFSPGASITDPLGGSSFIMHVVSYVDDNSLLRSFDGAENLAQICNTISSELTSWWKLLRITGGDLALEKCTYSIMHWKWTGLYNDRKLVVIEDSQATVQVATSEDKTVTLRQIAPHTAERQLGFQVSMDGNWNDEFTFRVDQVKKLTKKIYYAHISQFEALMAYTFYIKSTLYYALPLTVFSFDECETLNKLILNTILPKCCLNRHTPRALVYAPADLGGFGFDHVWTKQLSLHLQMFQKHIRRMDSLGKSMLCNINSIQLLIGRSVPFFSLDPTQHSYIDQTGCIFMIWKACFSLNIQCVIPKMCIPTPSTANGDKNLMDDALHDPLVCNNIRKLEAINQCRLYHGLFSLSDMSQYTGSRMNKGFLSHQGGRRIARSNLSKWPNVPCPTLWQWDTWKSFIYRHYITGSGFTIPFPIGSKTRIRQVCDTYAQLQRFLQTSHVSLQHSISALPSTLRYFIHNLHFCEPVEGSLLTDFRNGNLVGATDGSAHTMRLDGSYAFILMSTISPSTMLYGGGRLSPSPAVTSQHTEHYGAIAVLTVLLAMQQCLPGPFPTITIWLDNNHTVDRMQSSPTPTGGSKQYTSADFELWQLIVMIRNCLTFTLNVQWVKAHQDKQQNIQDLPLSARLNVVVDDIASKIYNTTSAIPYWSPHEDEGVFLSYQHVPIHCIESSLRLLVHKPDLMQYIMRKRQWNQHQYDSISWASLSQALLKVKHGMRLNLIQLVHNWQHTGYQKMQFAQSRTKSSIDVSSSLSRMPETHFRCPFCKTETEVPMHFVFCSVAAMEDDRKKLRQSLQSKLRKLCVFDGLIDVIIYLLRGHPIEAYRFNVDNNELKNAWLTAFASQSQIGWQSFIQGFWHTSWTEVQRIHISLLPSLPSNDYWMTTAIHHLLLYVYECWKQRNVMVHGDDPSEQYRSELQEKVRYLYMSPDRFLFSTKEKRRLYNVPLERKLNCSNASLESWIDLVEMRLRLDWEEHARRTLVRWLGNENNADGSDTL